LLHRDFLFVLDFMTIALNETNCVHYPELLTKIRDWCDETISELEAELGANASA
jgi:hypothetical protein